VVYWISLALLIERWQLPSDGKRGSICDCQIVLGWRSSALSSSLALASLALSLSWMIWNVFSAILKSLFVGKDCKSSSNITWSQSFLWSSIGSGSLLASSISIYSGCRTSDADSVLAIAFSSNWIAEVSICWSPASGAAHRNSFLRLRGSIRYIQLSSYGFDGD
jgi:hypothetical protein